MMNTHRGAAALALAMLVGACGGSSGPTPAATAAPKAPAGTSTSSASTTTSASKGPEVSPTGDIPDNQAYVAYRPASGAFEVKVPEGWSRTGSGTTVSFTDKLNTVSIDTKALPQAPTVDSVTRDEVPAIKAASTNYRAGTVTQARRKAGAAVLVTYGADAPPDPVTGKVVHDAVERYDFWGGGTEVVLTLAGPKGADNVDPWRIITDSLRWLP